MDAVSGRLRGESLFTYRGKSLPYMPFCYKHPEYWHMIKAESKKNGDMINSRKIFDDSEKSHPIQEDEFIKIEEINGKLVFIGTEDDALWDTAKYIRRAEKRLSERERSSDVEFYAYEHGTHYVFPESLLKSIFPVCSGMLLKLVFKAARDFPKECKETRIDIERNVVKVIKNWIEK